MIPMRIVLDSEALREEAQKLVTAGVETVPLEAALLVEGGTAKGNATVILTMTVDGRPMAGETTLALLEMAVRAMRARAGEHRE